MNQGYMRGFTLIELMIVVVIIGILAAIAYPSYMNSVLQGRRADGKALLHAVQLAQEKWRANSTTYTTDPGVLNVSATSGEGFYTLLISDVTGTGYVATVSAQNGQENDAACNPLVLTVSAANPNGVYTPDACFP